MGKDEWLIAFAPITVLTTGGFVAVNFFRNRQSTGDLDYLLEPQWAYDNDVKGPLQRAVMRAARHLSFVEDWANEEMALFTPKTRREHLFQEAERQNVVLWESTHLRVLAAPWQWSVERKLRRINNNKHHPKRGSDIEDVLTLLKHMKAQRGGPLNREHIRTSSICSVELPPDYATMDEITAAYRNKYQEEVFQ